MGYGAFTNYPYGVTSFGIPVIGSGGNLPLINTGGHYWFVSSVYGNNGNPGTFSAPFATLAFALQYPQLQANDTIIVMEGHTETVTAAGTATAGILASTTGVDIVGLGNGTAAPTITFTTATTATFKITGAGVTVQGLRFVNGINSQVTMLDIQAKGVVIQGNQFLTGASTSGLSFIDFVNASANAADGTKLLNNYFYADSAGNYNHAIGLNTVQDNIEIGNNYIYGNFALSGIHNVTGQVVQDVNIHDNYVKNLTAAKPALNFISAVTGVAYRNVFEPGDATVNSAKFGTALDASGGNRGWNGFLDAGSEFWFVKTGVVSSTITTGGVALGVASIGGAIAITDVIVKTNGTGLAGGTNFQLQTNNANGIAVFFAETVANLGASKTVNMATASVTANGRTVLESGKILTASSTVGNCTGAGTIDIFIRCMRLTAGADVSLA